MLLVHLSDIHFKKGISGTAMDPNSFIKKEFINDIAEQCRLIGESPAAIIISGDIAFAGQKEEYAAALSWLEEICSKSNTDLSKIFLVPGNHDIDRGMAENKVTASLRKTINDSGDHARERALSGHLLDENAGAIIYKPLEQYNNFAGRFLCDLFPPERTLARRDLSFEDGSILKISGLNSTVTSCAADEKGNLNIDPGFRQLTRSPEIVHLTVCHHPFEWLKLGEELKDTLASLSKIHLFGHSHKNRVSLSSNWIQVGASAVLPDREEQGWEPGYNLIEIDVTNIAGNRTLKTKIHVRKWQDSPACFVPKYDSSGNTFFSQKIDLPFMEPLQQQDMSVKNISAPPNDQPIFAHQEDKPTAEDSLRKICLLFFQLDLNNKLNIVSRLALLEESDANLPDFERFHRAILRAQHQNKTKDLAEEIKKTLNNNWSKGEQHGN